MGRDENGTDLYLERVCDAHVLGVASCLVLHVQYLQLLLCSFAWLGCCLQWS